jgi:hypothetical protein
MSAGQSPGQPTEEVNELAAEKEFTRMSTKSKRG